MTLLFIILPIWVATIASGWFLSGPRRRRVRAARPVLPGPSEYEIWRDKYVATGDLAALWQMEAKVQVPRMMSEIPDLPDGIGRPSPVETAAGLYQPKGLTRICCAVCGAYTVPGRCESGGYPLCPVRSLK